MTELSTSPVARRATSLYKGRRIVVTLRADDCIELRLERLRDSKIKINVRDLYEYLIGARTIRETP